MAEYIELEALKERLEDFSKWCKDGRKQGVDFVLDCPLPDMPTADVVPKSEVDSEIKVWQELYADTVSKWEKAYEELEIKLENAKAEVVKEFAERLHNLFDVDCEKTHGGIDKVLQEMTEGIK